MSIFKSIRDWKNDFKSKFAPGMDDRFPSLVTAVFRFLLRYLLILAAVIYIGMVIAAVATGQLTIGPALITGILATALTLAALFVVFIVLMGLESFAKIIACLIQYGELPSRYDDENIADEYVLDYIVPYR